MASSESTNTGDSPAPSSNPNLEALHQVALNLHARRLSPAGNDRASPVLDPNSTDFDHYQWAGAFLASLNQGGINGQPQDLVVTNLRVSGSGSAVQFQDTVISSLVSPFRKAARSLLSNVSTSARREILHGFDAILQSGELLLVLGRPGSGCSTFLKTISGRLDGLRVEEGSDIHYRGIDLETMMKNYRGEVCYNEELDKHFPHLTVGETLAFAAFARAPRELPYGLTRSEFVKHLVDVIMGIFGLTSTYNTKVGDNFVRGVSGGERKRVSIAEMFISRVRIGAWDNSTRGLDSASALQFIQALRLSAVMGKACHAVAAYQSSESMFDLFDKVLVLYEGKEVFYGPREEAVQYFEQMGWKRHPQQTAPDFLTAVTSPGEREPIPGMEAKVPRTSAEFGKYWKESNQFKSLQIQLQQHRLEYPIGGSNAEKFQASHKAQQLSYTRASSPYLLSIPMQIRLCLQRAVQRLRNDFSTTMGTVVVQIILSLIIGSIFFNSPNTSSAFFQKGGVMFFAVMMNAMITITEIMTLYSQRPIVEKQAFYAFVHPFTEALASVLIDLPFKLLRCSVFCVVLYFMANLRREPGPFFVFYLFLVTAILTMSGVFRTLGSVTKTVGQAMAMAGVVVICIVVYTGFTIPQTYMRPWFSWIRWINPIYYAFESLISNEFHGRTFGCAAFVPPYGTGNSFICEAVGSIAGQLSVPGDVFIRENYNYSHSRLWRNYAILVGFMVAFHCFYFAATEFIRSDKSRGETLVFRPGHGPTLLDASDGEALQKSIDSSEVTLDTGDMRLPKHVDTLTWKGLNYEVPVKDGTKRLLDNVNGWVKPGTLTALMGSSGAGKTTLLDVLAQRVSIGVVSGDIRVNGNPITAGFPRRTGYVQQQDLHLETATVRESLRFSASLRQHRSVSQEEKYEYVEQIIQMLGMENFAESVVGIQGQGLNVEQRKLLSIGVELVAKPTLLIFLDEPTSGLDSQSSWTICTLLKKLARSGQAVLATIHQPSAMLFQTFDRLLFLARGGRTVYFGDIGPQSRILLGYFGQNGARPCGELENPAEYILEQVNNNGKLNVDWVEKWNNSNELKEIMAELGRIERNANQREDEPVEDNGFGDEFALPLYSQFWYVAMRAFQQHYRQPAYVLTKFLLGIVSGLFIGFSFWKADDSSQGFQNAMFSIFLLCGIFSTLVNQIMPRFVVQRSLYEVRERPSKIYSWKVFIVSQILAEIPWQALIGICAWASFYYAVFGATTSPESQGIVLLFVMQFYIYAASLAHMVVAGVEDATLAALFATLMFGLSFIFNGVMQPPDALPGFWIFMYRLSPFTYFVSGISSSALHGRKVQCSSSELKIFDPPSNQTCGAYLAEYLKVAAGQLYNHDATSGCEYCPMTSADQYLAARRIYYQDRWRNYGIFWCYLVFNIGVTVFVYYLLRIRPQRVAKKVT